MTWRYRLICFLILLVASILSIVLLYWLRGPLPLKLG